MTKEKIKHENGRLLEPIIGYKGFKNINGKLTCRDQEYEIGKTYIISESTVIDACTAGFHFCLNLADVFTFYSLSNKDHAFYKVKGSGRFDVDSDKIAVSEIEILEKVEEWEFFDFYVSKHLARFKALSENNPLVILGGSLSLILQGLIPPRVVKDLDIIAPYLLEIPGYEIKNRFNTSKFNAFKYKLSESDDTPVPVGGSVRAEKSSDLPYEFDLFVDPKQQFGYATYKDVKYKISTSTEIMMAKMKYFIEGHTKHGNDIADFIDNYNNPLKIFCDLSISGKKTTANYDEDDDLAF